MWIFYILLTCVILNLHRWGRCLTRTGPKYIGSSFWTESLRMNVGYTNSFSIWFFVNTYDTVHIVLIKIHIVFTITYNTYGACGEFFFSEIGLSRGRSITPFFWAKRPLPPPPPKNASAAKPILACLYKTLTMGEVCTILCLYLVLTYVCRLYRILLSFVFFVLLNSYVCRWNKIFRVWIFYILLTCV